MGRRKGIHYDEIKEVADEIQSVGKTLGVSKQLAEKVVTSQFDFIKYIIQRGDFETVRLMYIGKFHVSNYLLKLINDPDGIVQNRKSSRSPRQPRGSDDQGVQEDNSPGHG